MGQEFQPLLELRPADGTAAVCVMALPLIGAVTPEVRQRVMPLREAYRRQPD
jgi:hypothetical protein